jgi:transmembrane sensor
VEIDFSAEVRNVELIKGEALFNVVQASNRPFVVDVIDHNVVAVGTMFNLQITNAALKIAVVEGQVAVRHQDAIFNSSPGRSGELDEGMLLNAGQGVEVNADGTLSQVATVNVQRATAWDRGLLVFDEMPLRQATEKMSRYMLTDLRVVVGIPDKIVSGEIQIRDQETMLKQFAKIAQVTPVRQSAQLTLLYTASQ